MQTDSDTISLDGSSRLSVFDRRSSIFDIIIVAIPFIAILFNRWLGPLSPLLVLAITPLYILLRWERLYSVFVKCWPLLLLPGFALVSVFWSDEPSRTLRYGTLYILTVIPAIFVGAGSDKDALIKGIFIAFAIYMFLSVPFGRWVVWGGSGGQAFAGLLGSKNSSGDAAALAILCTVAMFFWALSKRRIPWLVGSLLVLPLALFTLWASKSTGAVITTILALPCLLLWTASRLLARQVRVSIFVISFLIATILVATVSFWMGPLFEAVMENSGKDAGLTGRDVLWRKADQLIQERPWFGRGYNAFWVHNNLDAEFLWREMGIKGRNGFNFHNTPRGILVHLGITGLALFLIIFLYASFRLLIRSMMQPDMSGILCCTLLVFEAPRFYVETIGFQNMHIATLIIFILLSYGLRPNNSKAIGMC